jgi:hypothetical protein
VSRVYVNNINVTNTAVNVTKVTNVYNTVIINKTTVNNITYVNQHVTNGVTVVSHDAFVNARPAAQNLMHVDAREIASAPVTHVVAAEPMKTSVIGAGRPVSVRPPAAVINRPVVAVRTPAPQPQSIEQRQAQAGGHLNQQALVRPAAPAQPVQMTPGKSQPNQEGFRSSTQPSNGNSPVKVQPNAQPRTFEAQGNPEPERQNAQPENHNANGFQPNQNGSRPQQQARPAPQQSHPLVRPTPPVQERSPEQEQQQAQKFNQWQQQRASTPPPKPQQQPKSEPAKSAPPQKH